MSEVPADLMEKVQEVTGCTEAVAKNILSACNNNVEAAVTLYFEGEGEGSSLTANNVGQGVAVDDDVMELDEPIVNDPQTAGAANAEDVRAPIKPIRQQLLAPEDDNFMAATANVAMAPSSLHHMRNARRLKVCPLRDFAREGAMLEQQLQAQGRDHAVPQPIAPELANNGGLGTSASSRVESGVGPFARGPHQHNHHHHHHHASGPQSQEPKRKRLEDLYRPPTDIAFPGPFQAARTRAEILNQWVLVNVQSDNFDSQLLNRDVWSDTALRKLLRKNFLLWQVDVDSSEGRRFVTFYHCSKLPYLCVIDPRTGEEVWKSTNPTQMTVLPDLMEFLRTNKDFGQGFEENATKSSNGRTSTATDCDIDYISDDSNPAATSRTQNGRRKESPFNIAPCKKTGDARKSQKQQLTELTEEEQLALAIRNSIAENGDEESKKRHRSIGDGDYNELIIDSDDAVYDSDSSNAKSIDKIPRKASAEPTITEAVLSYEKLLGSAKDEHITLKLRLFNADKTDQLVQLSWPSDTRFKILRLYIAQEHSHIPTMGYKVICAFPRTVLDSTYDNKTLKECGLYPSANLHITLDD